MTWLEFSRMGDGVQTSTSVETGGSTVLCPLCLRRGQKSRLCLFQINLTEAVSLCSDVKCTYPLGHKSSQDLLVYRDSTLANFPQKRKIASKKDNALKKKKVCTGKIKNPVKTTVSCVGTTKSSQRLTSLNTDQPVYPANSLNTDRPVQPGSSLNTDRPFHPANSLNTDQRVHCGTSLDTSNPTNVLHQKILEGNVFRNKQENGDTWIAQSRPSRYPGYPLWRSETSQCWINCLLYLLVHSHVLHGYCQQAAAPDSPIKRLLQGYKKACGFRQSADVMPQVTESLIQCRENMKRHLELKVPSTTGTADSIICGLKFLLSADSKAVQEMSRISYMSEITCEQCQTRRKEKSVEAVLSFPRLDQEFSMLSPHFSVSCELCQAEIQQKLTIERYGSLFFSHFVDGLPGSEIKQYDFVSPGGSTYMVTGMVQFRKPADSFVVWVRDVVGGTWMECDDMKNSVSCPSAVEPNFPLSQVHLVKWERVDQLQKDVPMNVDDGSHVVYTSTMKTSLRETLPVKRLPSPSSTGLSIPKSHSITVHSNAKPLYRNPHACSERLARMHKKFKQAKGGCDDVLNGGQHLFVSDQDSRCQNAAQCLDDTKHLDSDKEGRSKPLVGHPRHVDEYKSDVQITKSVLSHRVLSHRVLKYLPNNEKVRFALSELGQSSTDKINLAKPAERSKTFSGYVPKVDLKTSDGSKSCQRSDLPARRDQSKKNVKFFLGDLGKIDTAKISHLNKPGKSVLVHSKTRSSTSHSERTVSNEVPASPNLPYSNRLQHLAHQNGSASLPDYKRNRNVQGCPLVKASPQIAGIRAITKDDHQSDDQLTYFVKKHSSHNSCEDTSKSGASSPEYTTESQLNGQCVPEDFHNVPGYINGMLRPPPVQRSAQKLALSNIMLQTKTFNN